MLSNRAQQLVNSLPDGFEAALIGTPVSRFYLLDFDAHDAGHLLLFPDKMIYIIDSRYIEVARRGVTGAEVVLEGDAPAQIAAYLCGVKHLFVEDGITVRALNHLKTTLPNVEINSSGTLSKAIMALREVKDAEEQARMRRAQAITDACFAHILPFMKEGVREMDVALEMEHFMRQNGADGLAFDTICVAGANSSMPHGVPGAYRLQAGDFITLDFGAKYKGYCADMTRTVALGEVSEEKRRVYDAVLKAHYAGLAAARAGQKGSAVDKAARDVIKAAGYGDAFGHGLGHALGIEVHEDPRFSPKYHDVVRAGMVLSVEPGIYLPGKFGCRIEDAVVLTETGCEPLPKSPKELLVL